MARAVAIVAAIKVTDYPKRDPVWNLLGLTRSALAPSGQWDPRSVVREETWGAVVLLRAWEWFRKMG